MRLTQRQSNVAPRLGAVPHRWSRFDGAALSKCGEGSVGGEILPKHMRILRLPDAVLTFGGSPPRLVEIASVGRGTTTASGVGVGDPLVEVRRRLGARRPKCEGEVGDDGGLLWPSCRLRHGRRELYLGGDPISQIEMRDTVAAARP